MTKNRMLMSLLVIAMAAALIGGATMAWFTDAAETEVVDFQAGTLLINVDKLGDAEAANNTDFATLERLNPGDCWKWEFDVHNQGTKSANWLLYLCYQEETGLENLGEDAFGDREGFGTGRLSEVLEWTVEVEGDGVIYEGQNGGQTILEAPHVFDGLTAFGVPDDGADTTKHVIVTACLPESAGNEYQGAKMDIAFGVKAWQTTNGAKQPEVTGEDCPFDVDDNNGGDNGNGNNGGDNGSGDNGDIVIGDFNIVAHYGKVNGKMCIAGVINGLTGVPNGTDVGVDFKVKNNLGNIYSFTKTLVCENGQLFFGSGAEIPVPGGKGDPTQGYSIKAKIGEVEKEYPHIISF